MALPEYGDADVYRWFHAVVPPLLLTQRVRKRFPNVAGTSMLTAGWLFLFFMGPCAVMYQAIVDEILRWEFSVTHETVEKSNGDVVAKYVDRDRTKWSFGLQDEAVREARRRTGSPIYVYAEKKFRRQGDPGFRWNLGPEVFLPTQIWIYLILTTTSVAGVVGTFIRLTLLRREFRV